MLCYLDRSAVADPKPTIRAAEIIAIASHLGIPRRMIRDMLAPSYHLISMNLIESGLKVSVDKFLDRLLADWAQGHSS